MCIYRVTQVVVIAFLFSLPIVESESELNNMSGVEPSRCSWNHKDATKSRYYYRLIHTESGKYVALTSQRVTTSRKRNMWTELTVSAVYKEHHLVTNSSALMIKGTKSGVFLCFDKKGKLIPRAHFVEESCTFHELLTADLYTEFQSASHPNLYVGFTDKGRAMRGKLWRNSQCPKCFRFSKCSLDSGADQQRPQGPLSGNDKLTGLVKSDMLLGKPGSTSVATGIGHRHRHGHRGPRGQG